MTTPADLPRLFTVDLRLDAFDLFRGELMFAGRRIAWRPAHDQPVQLGEGVTLVTGGFADNGGSKARPQLAPAHEDTVLRVADVPLSATRPRRRGVTVVSGVHRAAAERSFVDPATGGHLQPWE